MSLNIPSPEVVLEELSPILPSISEALEKGTEIAKSYFEKKKQSIDPYLAAMLTRWHAKIYLEKEHIEVSEDDNYKMEEIANIGLFLKFGNFRIRILKSQNDELPTPGTSKTRQDFYQQSLDFSSPDDEDGKNSDLNIIVIWKANKDYDFQGLRLACPKAGNTTRASVEEHWNKKIPDQIQSIQAQIETTSNLEESEDLLILAKKLNRTKKKHS